MSLKALAYRLDHAGLVCTPCGLLYGSRVMRGNLIRQRGICHICDSERTVRPIEVFDHLRRGRHTVRRLAEGQLDEPTILQLLGIQPEAPAPSTREEVVA